MLQPVNRIAMFRTGDYGEKGKFSIEDLDAMTASYDVNYLQAPVTVDHQQTGPALGWITRVYREGDLLMGDWDLHPDTVTAIKEGRYTRRSIEFYRKHTMPDGRIVPYVKACSILGAATPHAKGMPPIQFSESAGQSIAIDFSDTTPFTGTETMHDHLTETAAHRLAETLVAKGYYPTFHQAYEYAKTQKLPSPRNDTYPKPTAELSKKIADRGDELLEQDPNLQPLEAYMQAERELLHT